MSNIFNDPTETQLNERTINFQNLSVLQPTLPILDIDNVVTGQVATSAGLSLLNITSIADLRSQILENDGEEAIRLTAGDGNELNFYTNGTTASELRLQITDTTTSINNTIEADDIKVDNANKIICNTYGYRDDNTNPTYLSFDAQHAHIAAPSGLMLNGGFNIRNGNHGEIATTNGNKNLYYKTHGTGTHTFYVNTTTQVLELNNTDSTFISTNLKTNNIVSNTDNTYNIGTSTNKYVKIYGDEVIGRYTRSNYDSIQNTFNEIEQFYTSTPSPIDIMNFTFSKTEATSGNTLMTIDGVADKVITYAKLELHDDLVLNSNIDLASLTTPFLNGYIDNIETERIRTPTNTHLEISPNGSGNIRTNRPLEIPAAQSIMLCKENNKHFQLNLAPRNEAPNSATDSYGSGLTFWSSFFSENDEAPRLFANINCRTTGTNWEGGSLEFRVREDQNSGYAGAISGDRAALTSLQMTITATTVDILKRLNVSSHIIPSTDNTSDLGELTKRFRNGYLEKLYVKENRVFGGFGAGAYIDLRGVGYNVDGELTTTSPIYFNTGYNAVFGDFSETRKSMIIGSGVSLPTGETGSFSRNNILFCVNNDGDNTISVSTSDEKFRVGQVANYTSVDILPNVNGTLSLGSSLKRWDYVHTTNIAVASTINSTTIYATTVQAPNINPTTIDFPETLADKILLYGTLYKIGISQNSIDYTTDNTHAFKVGTTQKMRIAGNVVASTNVIPNSDNTYDLGNSNNKWKEIYAGNNVINTSDRTQKKEIDYQNIDQYADELLKLKPCSYKFIDGTSNRPHTGLISQDLEGTMFELSGAYIKDRKKKTIIEDGITKEVDDEGFNYGLRYGELISPMLRLLQKQQEQITQQQQQINQQQEQINQLLKRVELLEGEANNELSFI